MKNFDNKYRLLDIAISEALHFSYDSKSFESEEEAESFREHLKDLQSEIWYIANKYDVNGTFCAEKFAYDILCDSAAALNDTMKPDDNKTLFDEEYASLRRLLYAIDDQLEEMAKHVEDDAEDVDPDILIVVHNTPVAFTCGCPQLESLYSFIDNLCGENLHPSIEQMRETR